MTKIALSNAHDTPYMGGTCIIRNQDICQPLAYTIHRTLQGDPIVSLKASGVGEQYSLPMQLKFC